MKMTRKQLRKIIREACCRACSSESGLDEMESEHEFERKGRKLGSGGSASMARGQLFTTAQKAQRLYDLLSDEDELPEWVQSKINTAHDYVDVVEDYLGYEIRRYDSGDPSPVYENRKSLAHYLFEEESEKASTGKQAKDGAVIDKVKKVFDKVPGLEPILKQVDTKNELISLIQAIVNHTIETGNVDQAEVNAALTAATVAAKKA